MYCFTLNSFIKLPPIESESTTAETHELEDNNAKNQTHKDIDE